MKNKIRMSVVLLVAAMFITVWTSESVSDEVIPIPQATDAQMEIFRISSDLGSEPIAPLQKEAQKPITGNAIIYSSATVWGEHVELRIDDKTFCGASSSVKCIIEQQPLVGGTSVIAINFDTKQIPAGTYKFTVITYPMPGPIPGYINTDDSILITVNS